MSSDAPTRVHRGLARAAGESAALLTRLPWWAQATLIWLISRLWAALLFVVVDRQSPDGPWGPTPLGYFNVLSIWDGQWYQQVHDDGYPSELPMDANGTVQPNAWAFYPVFPMLVRAITAVTGLPWALTASTVALLAGFAAAVVILKLFQEFLTPSSARWALAVVAFAPVSPIFQAAYAESLHLALLAGALLLALREQVLWSVGLILVMCLTRPAGVPFAAALGLTWFIQAVGALRTHYSNGTLGASQVLGLFNKWFWLALWACACALIWPAVAWAVTGQVTAYTETETAWRGSSLVVFQPWFTLGQRFLGPYLGWLGVLVIVVGFALLITTRTVRRTLPLIVWMWVVCYAVYLLAFLHPQSSTFRMLAPLFVLAAPLVAASPSRAYRITLVVVGALLQIVWVGYLWQWSPLPGGGDWPP